MRETLPNTYLPVPAPLRAVTDVIEATGVQLDPAVPATTPSDERAKVLLLQHAGSAHVLRGGRHRLSESSHRLHVGAFNAPSWIAQARDMVVARAGHTFVTVCPNRAELRVLAYLSGDATLATALDGDLWAHLLAGFPAALQVSRAQAKHAFFSSMYVKDSRLAGKDHPEHAVVEAGLRAQLPDVFAYRDEAMAGGGMTHVLRMAGDAVNLMTAASAAAVADLATPVLFLRDELILETPATVSKVLAALGSVTVNPAPGLTLRAATSSGARLSHLGI